MDIAAMKHNNVKLVSAIMELNRELDAAIKQLGAVKATLEQAQLYLDEPNVVGDYLQTAIFEVGVTIARIRESRES